MKKRGGGEECGSWMDTYGDMVTLLLCFFVMLYSMSNLNEEKWKIFVRSIFPAAAQDDAQQVGVNQPEGEEGIDGTVKIEPTEEAIDINTLYLEIAKALNEQGVEGVSLSRGEGYTYIVFQDKTFFDGNSSIITDQGRQTLDIFCSVLAPWSDSLSQIDIMAHTAQGEPDRPNNPRTDRMLSAMRAAEVCVFIQDRGVIEPDKLVDISYGQFRPVSANDTREGRAKNRRVELLLIDEGADVRSLNEYYEEYASGVNADTTLVTDGRPPQENTGFATMDGSLPEGESSLKAPLTAPDVPAEEMADQMAGTVSPSQEESLEEETTAGGASLEGTGAEPPEGEAAAAE